MSPRPRRRPRPGAGRGALVARRGRRVSASHILVTGFEPFGHDAVNPSQELAKALDGHRAGGAAVVRARVLPVQHEAARAALAPVLGAPGLCAVVHFGLAGGRARLALEAVAVNRLDYAIPDARGDLRRDEPCTPGGPAAYWSMLPLRAILRELTAAGLPAYISYTAGTSLCNFTLYSTLDRLARLGLAVPAGFMHLPYLPAMVASHGVEEPSMDLGAMLRAAEIVLAEVARASRA
jgi:pyroglutamyl-peptidase